MEQNKRKKNKKLIITIIITLVLVMAAVFVVVAVAKPVNVKAAEYTQQGYRYLEELDYEQAVAAFENAIEIDPKYVPAYSGTAIAYEQMGDADKVIEVLNAGYQQTESDLLDYMAEVVETEGSLGEEFATEEVAEQMTFDGRVFESLKVLGSAYYTWDVDSIVEIAGLDYASYVGQEVSLGSYKDFNVVLNAQTENIEFRASDGNVSYRYTMRNEAKMQLLEVACSEINQQTGLSEIEMSYAFGLSQSVIEEAAQLAGLLETENTFYFIEYSKGIASAIKWTEDGIIYIYVNQVGADSLSVQFAFTQDSLQEVKYTCGIPDNLKSNIIKMFAEWKRG